MELRTIVIIAGIIFCRNLSAETPAWTIQPNICVAQRVGDECQLTISIETQNMPSEKLCLYLDGKLLNCSQRAYFYNATSVLIKKNALIELKNKAQETILSKKLLIKYLDPQQRRRVRPPWSLF
ncbi:DUF3019 domain-containing protein [Paraglaciecola arctica]|uniref:DUF3019 domain-containing protein n=1 Tax=Paraglaciecola arctica TaxID=1128911 RepID=UPI001C064E94|nr:DUF3019 domain-containing protein [Paraglaciecola arctica]MBU3004681.1 DUF3019 domain-containing protein [Paraglaciecola arctica]